MVGEAVVTSDDFHLEIEHFLYLRYLGNKLWLPARSSCKLL